MSSAKSRTAGKTESLEAAGLKPAATKKVEAGFSRAQKKAKLAAFCIAGVPPAPKLRVKNHRGQNREWSVLINAADLIEANGRDNPQEERKHDDGPHRARAGA